MLVLLRLVGFFFALLLAYGGSIRSAEARQPHRVPDLRAGPKTGRSAGPTRRASAIQIPLTIHVASDARGKVAPVRRVARWIERANSALAPYGIEVSVRSFQILPGGYTDVTRWRHRRQLARYASQDGSVHVFIVDELDIYGSRADGRRVRGMHWRYRGFSRELAEREYLVVTDDAPLTTLAHELGHLFGLRHHSGQKNLMCSCRRGPGQRFTASQGATMRSGAWRFVKRQERMSGATWADRAERRR